MWFTIQARHNTDAGPKRVWKRSRGAAPGWEQASSSEDVMNASVAYSPKKDDLFFPCKNAQFFSAGAPTSDAALCVELARLAYCRSDANVAFDQVRIRTELERIGFTATGFFESQGTPQGRGTHCFLAMSQDQELAVAA